jgi:hypothetical protein
MKTRGGFTMRHLLIGIAYILLSAHASHAFEVDGLSSGMSMERARKTLEAAAYTDIQTRENRILAYGGNRFILLNFCKDELVLLQKHLTPAFAEFVRLVDGKKKELGKPAEAWVEPVDEHLPIERNAVCFLWRDGSTSVKVTFTEFASNNQLDILYEIKNPCKQVLR